MSYSISHRCGSDLALLWLCFRLVATAPIQPLAWEPPYAAGAARELATTTTTTTKKDKKRQKTKKYIYDMNKPTYKTETDSQT